MFESVATLPHHKQEIISLYFSKVYTWMFGALALSGLVAWKAANSAAFMEWMMAHPNAFYGMIIGELALVIGLSWGIKRLSFATATLMFILYSLFTGLTLSMVLLIYTAASIAKVFVITAGLFGAMAVYGYTTKKDLTSWGSFLIMALMGLILASVVNLFMHSAMLDWITTYAGIIIFVGLTAYDNQKLKRFATMGDSDEMFGKLVILGALTLYLDFINLFLHLLRAMGNRR